MRQPSNKIDKSLDMVTLNRFTMDRILYWISNTEIFPNNVSAERRWEVVIDAVEFNHKPAKLQIFIKHSLNRDLFCYDEWLQQLAPPLCYEITVNAHIDGLVQDSSNSSDNALALLQSCTKPPIYLYVS